MLCDRVLTAIPVPDSTRIRSLMARVLRSPIARENSQVVPRVRHEPALSQPLRERIEHSWRKVQSLCSVWVLRDDKLITWQRLPADDLAQVVGEVLDRR